MHIQRASKIAAPALIALLTPGLFAPARSLSAAEDPERLAAQARAEEFLETFGEGRHRTLYRELLGSKYRDAQSEEDFVQQYSAMHRQVGGAGAERRLIDGGRMDQINSPSGPIPGSYFYFRFKADYPAGSAYEDLYLEEEEEEWRVVGVWLAPAPS